MTPTEQVALIKQRATETAEKVVDRNQTVSGLRDLASVIQVEQTFNAATLKSPHVARHLDAALVHVTAALVALATQPLFPDEPAQ